MQQQKAGEKLSDFLRRLERCLSKVIQRGGGGLPPRAMDGARLEHLLRGAVNADLMLIQLRLRERSVASNYFFKLAIIKLINYKTLTDGVLNQG